MENKYDLYNNVLQRRHIEIPTPHWFGTYEYNKPELYMTWRSEWCHYYSAADSNSASAKSATIKSLYSGCRFLRTYLLTLEPGICTTHSYRLLGHFIRIFVSIYPRHLLLLFIHFIRIALGIAISRRHFICEWFFRDRTILLTNRIE